MIYPDEDMKRWECCDTQVVLANANYYYTKGQVDKKLDEIDGMTEEEVQTMINRSIRTKADKSDVNALSGQVEDNTEAIANTYTKREVDNAITAATAPVNNTLTAHTANTSIHVTSQEKTYWNNKLDASAYTPTDLSNYYTKGQTDDLLDDKLDVTAYTPTDLSNYYTKQETQGVVNGAVSGKADTSAVTQEVSSAVAPLFGAVEYDSQTQRINFKHDATGQTIAYVDATDFIKDGMVSNVEIVNGNLVITFNSDAGKQPISIPLTDIFDPANYYTTAQTQSYVSGFTYDKATIDQKVASGGTFDPDLYYDKTATDALLAAKADTATTYTKTEVDTALGNKADTSAVTAVASDVQTVSGQVATKVATSDFNTYTAATATALSGKADASALDDYYTKTEVYNKQEVDSALSGKADSSDVYTKSEVDTAIGRKQDTLVSGTNIKTINNESILGSGNITIQGGGSNVIELTQAQYDALTTIDPDAIYVITDATAFDPSTKVDTSAITSSITSSSTNSEVAGAKAVYDAIQAGGGGGATYSAGTNISIDTGNTISCTLPISSIQGYNGIIVGKASYGNGYRHIVGGLSCNVNAKTNSYTPDDCLVIGQYLNANNTTEVAFGKYNTTVQNTSVGGSSGTTAFSIGNGDRDNRRHNALEIRRNGDLYFADTDNTTYQNDYQKPMVRLQDMYGALGGLKFVSLTQSEYDSMVSGGTIDSSTIYFITNVVS